MMVKNNIGMIYFQSLLVTKADFLGTVCFCNSGEGMEWITT